MIRFLHKLLVCLGVAGATLVAVAVLPLAACVLWCVCMGMFCVIVFSREPSDKSQ